MIGYGHFIGGRNVAGKSGRSGRRVPADGRHGPRQGRAGLQSRTPRGGRERQGRPAGLGARPTRSAAPAC